MDLEFDPQALKDQLTDLTKAKAAPSVPATAPAPGTTQDRATMPAPSNVAGHQL